MIRVNGRISIPGDEVVMTAVTSQGPGGQNVNKVATAVQLRFDVARSSLPPRVKVRLLAMRDRRLTKEGVIVIRAQRYRRREQNRDDAVERLAVMIRKALAVPARRKKTAPSRAARQRRLTEKKRRSEIKKTRRSVE